MEKRFNLNKTDAEKQTARIAGMSSEAIQALTADELLPLWYALCYTQSKIQIDTPETWGGFRDFVGAVHGKYEEGIFSGYQAERQLEEIRQHAYFGLPCEVLDEICPHCQENYLDVYDSSSAYDLDGNDIQICATCLEEDFQHCREPRCGVAYPNDANGCPSCGGAVCTRRK